MRYDALPTEQFGEQNSVLDLYYDRPYHIVPSAKQFYLQQLYEQIAAAVDVPVVVEFTVSYNDYFRIRLTNYDLHEAEAYGDDFDAVLDEVIANFAGQVLASRAYQARLELASSEGD